MKSLNVLMVAASMFGNGELFPLCFLLTECARFQGDPW